MTDRLSPTDVQNHFDQGGRVPGCYSLVLETPSDRVDKVIRRWAGNFDAPMPGEYGSRLAEASRFVYVGSHARSVYERLMQHAEGEQSSTIMDVWPPVGIDGILRSDTPKEMEYSYAVDRAARDGTVAWRDGELHG